MPPWPAFAQAIRVRPALPVRFGAALAAAICVGAAVPAPLGRSTQAFDVYPQTAGSATVLKRMLSPLAWDSIQSRLAMSGARLEERALDLSSEHFQVYVPEKRPPRGYGLLVFISPNDRGDLPLGWKSALDEHGVIFVAAERSGNDQAFLTRRAPLALSAAANIESRYVVDPDRVIVGGFSGGSRVALRLALAFPEVFRGAFLDAGADPLGAPPIGLPNVDQLRLAQEHSRFAYITGAQDLTNLEMASVSAQSLRRWCVFGVDTLTLPDLGHEVANGYGLARALDIVFAAPSPDTQRLAACRARSTADASSRLERTRQVVRSDPAKARKALLDLDGAVGGLVAPELRDLAEHCACGVLGAQTSSDPTRERR